MHRWQPCFSWFQESSRIGYARYAKTSYLVVICIEKLDFENLFDLASCHGTVQWGYVSFSLEGKRAYQGDLNHRFLSF